MRIGCIHWLPLVAARCCVCVALASRQSFSISKQLYIHRTFIYSTVHCVFSLTLCMSECQPWKWLKLLIFAALVSWLETAGLHLSFIYFFPRKKAKLFEKLVNTKLILNKSKEIYMIMWKSSHNNGLENILNFKISAKYPKY